MKDEDDKPSESMVPFDVIGTRSGEEWEELLRMIQ